MYLSTCEHTDRKFIGCLEILSDLISKMFQLQSLHFRKSGDMSEKKKEKRKKLDIEGFRREAKENGIMKLFSWQLKRVGGSSSKCCLRSASHCKPGELLSCHLSGIAQK